MIKSKYSILDILVALDRAETKTKLIRLNYYIYSFPLSPTYNAGFQAFKPLQIKLITEKTQQEWFVMNKDAQHGGKTNKLFLFALQNIAFENEALIQ